MFKKHTVFLALFLYFGSAFAYTVVGNAWTQITTTHGSANQGANTNLTTSVSGSAIDWKVNVTVNSTASYTDCTPDNCLSGYSCVDGGVTCEGDTCTRSCTSCEENVGDYRAPGCVGTYCTASCTSCSQCYQYYTPSNPPTCSGCDSGSSSCDEYTNTYPCSQSEITATNYDSGAILCSNFGSSSNRITVSNPTSIDGYSSGTWACTSDFFSWQSMVIDVGLSDPLFYSCDMQGSATSKSYHTVGQSFYTITGSCNLGACNCLDDGWRYYCSATSEDSRSCSPGNSVYGSLAPGASISAQQNVRCDNACGNCVSIGGECTNNGCRREGGIASYASVYVSWSYSLVRTGQGSSCPDTNWCAGSDTEGSCSPSCTSCSQCYQYYTPSNPPTCSGCDSGSSSCDACGTCNFNQDPQPSCARPSTYPDAPSIKVNGTEIWRAPGNFNVNEASDCVNQITPPCSVYSSYSNGNCNVDITACVTNSNSNITFYGGSSGSGSVSFSLKQYQQKSEGLQISQGTRIQNTTVTSSTGTQYIRKPFTITNNYTTLSLNTEDVVWSGDCDAYSNCYYSGNTIASMTPNQETTVYALGSDDKITEVWSNRQQYSTPTVNGTSYDSVNLTLTNGDASITWQNIAYTNSTGCRATWSTGTTSGTVSSLTAGGEATSKDAITCSKSNVIFVSNAENWAQDTAWATTLASNAYVFGDVRVNNTDTLLTYTSVSLTGATVGQYCRTTWSNTYGLTTTIGSISPQGSEVVSRAINCTKSNAITTTTGTGWQQRTALTSVVGSNAYIEGKVRGSNTDADVGYSSVYYSDSVSTAERRDGTWSCLINDTYSDLSASASSTGTATNFYLNCTKSNVIQLGDSWNWTQDTSYVTYAGGQSYVIGSVNATNTDTINYVGVSIPVSQIQSAGCDSGWSYLSGTQKNFNVLASSTSSIPACIVCNKNNTITDTLINHSQKTPVVGEPVGFWYNVSWRNSDASLSFENISKTYKLTYCTNITYVIIDGTTIYNTSGYQVENQAVVDIDSCNVTIYNQTLTSGSTNNVSLSYSVPSVANSLLTEIQGSAYVNRQVPFVRTETITSTAGVDIYSQPINVTMTYPFYNESLHVYLPNGTEQTGVTSLNTTTDGWVYWVIDTVTANSSEYWTINYNSTLINMTTTESISDSSYNQYIGIDSGTMTYGNVNVTTDIFYNSTSGIGVIGLYLIDNTSGVDVTVASNDIDYGPPKSLNRTTNGFPRQFTFNDETLSEEGWFKIIGVKGTPLTIDITKVQITKPVLTGDNVQWRWEVNITNPNNFPLICGDACIIGDDSDEIMSSDASNIRVNDISPQEIKVVGGNWWYTNYTTMTFIANQSVQFNMTFRTPAVASYVVTLQPQRYWVDYNAIISKEITFTNYADVEVFNITRMVSIEEPMGYEAKLFKGNDLIKKYGTVYGQVNVTIPSLKSGESKKYDLNYEIDTAQSFGCFKDSIFACTPVYQPRRIEMIVNNESSTYMCQLVKIVNSIGRPINNLWFRARFENCNNIAFVNKLSSTDDTNTTGIHYSCEKDAYNNTEIHVDYGNLGAGSVADTGWLRVCQTGDFSKPDFPVLPNFINYILDFFQKLGDWIKNALMGFNETNI